MYLLNITFAVDRSADSDFREWADSKLLPALAVEGREHILFTYIGTDPEHGVSSYAVQFRSAEPSAHESALDEWFPELAKRHGDSVLHFSTVMTILNAVNDDE